MSVTESVVGYPRLHPAAMQALQKLTDAIGNFRACRSTDSRPESRSVSIRHYEEFSVTVFQIRRSPR